MKYAKNIALGGVLGALAMTVMVLGGMIPVSTYICPVFCILILRTVLTFCGTRIAWAWYMMVSILCLLLGPDKEAAALLVMLGYYPIIKPKLEKLPLPVVWKLLLFNAVILVMYTLVVAVLGFEQVVVENTVFGYITLAATILLGNATFFLLDKILDKFSYKKTRK